MSVVMVFDVLVLTACKNYGLADDWTVFTHYSTMQVIYKQ